MPVANPTRADGLCPLRELATSAVPPARQLCPADTCQAPVCWRQRPVPDVWIGDGAQSLSWITVAGRIRPGEAAAPCTSSRTTGTKRRKRVFVEVAIGSTFGAECAAHKATASPAKRQWSPPVSARFQPMRSWILGSQSGEVRRVPLCCIWLRPIFCRRQSSCSAPRRGKNKPDTYRLWSIDEIR